MMKSIILTESKKSQFNTNDFIYQCSSFSKYLEILQWLKDNNIWYHRVYREDAAATTEETNNTVRGTRRELYGDIGDQLDEIFKDIDAWKTRIQGIKDANPKS